MKTLEIDIRGQVCPSSLLMALRTVNQNFAEISKGDLQVIIDTDNRDATGTIPDAANNMGMKACVEKMDGFYRIIVSSNE